MGDRKLAELWVHACQNRKGREWVAMMMGNPFPTESELVMLTQRIAKIRKRLRAQSDGLETLPRMPYPSKENDTDLIGVGIPVENPYR